MILELDEAEQFFRLHRALMFFVNQRLKVVDAEVRTPDEYSGLPPKTRIRVHQALLEHRELIDAFADENPFQFSEEDLEVVRSWKDLVSGTFYAFRQLQKYMVFLNDGEPTVAYGVVALTEPFEALIGPDLPQLVKTILLPFRGRIVYDGLISGYNIIIGPNIRRGLNESYREAKEHGRIITTLPPPPPGAGTALVGKKAAAKKRSAGGGSTAAETSRAALDRVVALTDAFCREHLDDEYAALCRTMAGVLARKRPSPLVRGKPESWACGVVRALGSVNFLGDPSMPHHMKMTDIDAGFGVSEATGSAKATAIRKLLKIRPFDPEWTVPSLMDQNPMAWMIQVNGLIVDARQLPREIQEEAHRKGLIPYVPADRPGKSS